MNRDDNVYIIVAAAFFVIVCLLVYIGIDCLEVNNLRDANEQLKKESYECKQELNKYKNKYLNMVTNGE